MHYGCLLPHNASMEWQATDQFGNLYVGESNAQTIDELRPHLAMLLTAVRERAGDAFQLTVDFDYAEISGPEPDRVTHVLRVPWLGTVGKGVVFAQLADSIGELCAQAGLTQVALGSA